MRRSRLLPLLLLAAPWLATCADPVHADAVEALGPEVRGVREGPNHRPGQPCLTCHGERGPGQEFAAGGTIYRVRGQPEPYPGVVITLRDAKGEVRRARSNEVGNFWIEEWEPTFPMYASISVHAKKPVEMLTRIGRNAGCGECHRSPQSASKMPGIYYFSRAEEATP